LANSLSSSQVSGVALGLLPPEGRDLILAGAILSITVNPLVFFSIDPLLTWFRARPRLTALLERPVDRFSSSADRSKETGLRDHAIIVGYGRVGEILGEALKAQKLAFVVIDENRRRVEKLRKEGLTAVYGDATAAGVLEEAGACNARLLIVAIPQGFFKRRIIELARECNPHIDTAIRTHRASELAYLKDKGIGIAIMGERETAFGLLRYALCSLGLPDEKAQIVVKEARLAGDAGAFERKPDIELPEAPLI
jgi:CPA2 family monovalent cation:H+ antiporter-2